MNYCVISNGNLYSVHLCDVESYSITQFVYLEVNIDYKAIIELNTNLQEDGSLVTWDLRESSMMHSFSRISVGDSEIGLRPPTFSTGVLCVLSFSKLRLFPDCKLPRICAKLSVVNIMLSYVRNTLSSSYHS